MPPHDDPQDDTPIVDWGHQGWEIPSATEEERDSSKGEGDSSSGLWNTPTTPETATIAASPETQPTPQERDHETHGTSRQDPTHHHQDKKNKKNKARPDAEVTPDEDPPKPRGRLVGRGLLMLIAAGYFIFMAVLSYEALGELHAEALHASASRIVEIQKTHATISRLALGNAIGGATFGLAGLLLLLGRRGLGKTLIFVGAVFLVVFLSAHFKHARPYLRDLDLLIKLTILSVASLSI